MRGLQRRTRWYAPLWNADTLSAWYALTNMHCETPLSFLMSYSTIDRARSQCRYSHHTSHGSHSNVISLSSRVDAPSKAPSRQHRAPYGIVLYRVMFSECSAILPYAANRSKALNNWPVTMLRKFALSQCSIAWLLLFDCSAMALIFQQLSFSFYWVYAFHLVALLESVTRSTSFELVWYIGKSRRISE